MASSTPTIEPEVARRSPTLADILADLGVPAGRVLSRPFPGTGTVEDVIAIRDREKRLCELVDGILVEKAMGYPESTLACVLIHLLMTYLDQHPLGIVAGPDGMIRLAPGRVRIPDVSFVSRDQFPDGKIGREPVPSFSPTLAVEILSPSNSKTEMDRKLVDYFAAGSKLVWYLDPVDRTVRVYTSPKDMTLLDESGTLDGGEVLPGFRLEVREWFARAENPLG